MSNEIVAKASHFDTTISSQKISILSIHRIGVLWLFKVWIVENTGYKRQRQILGMQDVMVTVPWLLTVCWVLAWSVRCCTWSVAAATTAIQCKIWFVSCLSRLYVYMNLKAQWYWYLDSKASESVLYQVVEEDGAILFRLSLNYKAIVSVI